MEENIRCQGCDLLSVDDIEPLQSKNLKKISKKEKDKLSSSIKNNGIVFPFFIWKGTNESGKSGNYLIDGFHRLQICKEFEYKSVPVVYVKAENIEFAKKCVLLASSQFAVITQDGFDRFAIGLNIEKIKSECNFVGMQGAIDKKPEIGLNITDSVKLKYDKGEYKHLIKYVQHFRKAWSVDGNNWCRDEEIVLKCMERTVNAYENNKN